jgi:hypothetical protein
VPGAAVVGASGGGTKIVGASGGGTKIVGADMESVGGGDDVGAQVLP